MTYNRFATSVTLHQLRVFHAVAREGSFAAAAKALCISQPSVSESIQSLELLLGVKVLERFPGRKRVNLTPAGAMLLQACEEIERALLTASSNIAELRGGAHGSLVFGTEPCFGSYILPNLYDNFRRVYPGITIKPIIDMSVNIVRRLRQYEIDLAVVAGTVSQHGLVSELIGGYDVVLVGPTGHRLAGNTPAALAELAHEQLLLPDRSTPIRQAFDHLLESESLRLMPWMEVNSIEVKIQAIQVGLGIAPLSIYSAANYADDKRLCILNVERFPLHIPWALARPVGKPRPSVMLFEKHVRQCLLAEVSVAKALLDRLLHRAK
ncbi:MAG TPA: LysR family transcriptional regulator [Chloroflexota bacterium]|nr:LysR family transcriptional regulator [Chloroflexota bacterium]